MKDDCNSKIIMEVVLEWLERLKKQMKLLGGVLRFSLPQMAIMDDQSPNRAKPNNPDSDTSLNA